MLDRNRMNALIEDVELRFNNSGYAAHEIGWSEKKKHPDYDLWYVTSGEITIECHGGRAVARAGDIVFFNPGVPYSAECHAAACTHIFIHFDFPVGKRINFLDEFGLMGLIPQRYFQEEGPRFRASFDAFKNKEPMSALVLKGYFLVLLAKLLAASARNPLDKMPSAPQRGSYDKLKPVLQYIDDHIEKQISAEHLAELISMSPKYFYAFFKANIGLTPQHYITKMKMNRARELLMGRKLTVKQIAYQLGFSDPYTFSKIFKRFHQQPPSRFTDHT
ncbi:helix-turn-helix domain-containing protein [Paenibacillus sp. 2TAB23]|uniref:AraC family transcriptional regulator n=1 Tax=Paenibacillus sp. 2TAB23 TaxID=3233004 RepID=UPI003F9CFE5B